MSNDDLAIAPIDQLEQLRTTLDRLHDTLKSQITVPSGFQRSASERLAFARSIYKARRTRRKAFPGNADIFHEPAWDMLLDLYISQVQGLDVSINSACIAADVAATTALRWIGTLESRNLVKRHQDPFDRRRSYVRLTENAFESMEQFLTPL